MSRILITALVTGQGGVAVKTVELAEALRKNGQEVHEIYFKERPSHPFLDTVASGARVVDDLTPMSLAGVISGIGPDLIMAAYSTPMAAALLASPGNRPPSVAVVHGQGVLFTNRPPLVKEMLSEFSRVLLGRMGRIVCVSASLGDEVLARGVAVENVRVIHNGLFLEMYRYVAHPCPDRPRLLFVGSLHPEKRVDLLIRALGSLRSSDPTLDICGDGPAAAELGEMASGLPVTFHAHVDDPREMMRESSILVLPSDSEGFPSVLMEAAAIGLPVVCTDIPGCREVLGEHAIFFEPGNAGALSDAIDKALSSWTEVSARARSAREWVVERHSWERIAGEYLEVVDELTRGGGDANG